MVGSITNIVTKMTLRRSYLTRVHSRGIFTTLSLLTENIRNNEPGYLQTKSAQINK